MSVVLACDLGGTSFRAVLVDDEGVARAECASAGPTVMDDGPRSEIDANRWWEILLSCAGQLADAAPTLFADLRGVAICGITRTQVFVDRQDRQLRPAMTWKDTRAEAIAERLRTAIGGHPEERHMNAFHPLARLAWLREHDPASFWAVAHVLEPKDWLNFRLTGQPATDPVSMARLLACREPAGDIDALSAAGVPASILPPVIEAQHRVGTIRPGLPAPFDRLAGVPVFGCSNDTWAAVLGLGALRSGMAYNISGTTEVLGVVDAERAEAEGLMTVDWRGLWQLGGPSQNGADTAAWFASLIDGPDAGRGTGAAMADLLGRPRSPEPLLFLPYLQGERVPYWDPTLRGAFVGLSRRHGATDLAYAVLEGVAFQNRIVLERAEAALGHRAHEMRIGGGAAANSVWCQMKADVCGTPVVVGSSREPGVLGSALVAWTGLGRFGSLQEAQAALVAISCRYEPDPVRRASYNRLFALYRKAEQALAPISSELARWQLSPDDLPGIRPRPEIS